MCDLPHANWDFELRSVANWPTPVASSIPTPGSAIMSNAKDAAVDAPEITDQEVLYGVPSRGESRWAVVLVIIFRLLVDTLIPHLPLGPQWGYRGMLVALLIPLCLGFLHGRRAERWSRAISLVILTVLACGNVVALVLILTPILDEESKFTGHLLILGAVYIWLVNVLVLGIIYWEVDRGGPKARMRAQHDPPGLLFPQMSNPGVGNRGWGPQFSDYMYVSLTNAMAFSPADSIPLTRLCKMLMAFQSLVSLLTFALVAGRAINILSQGE